MHHWINQIDNSKKKKKSRDKWQEKPEDPKLMWCSKISSKREVYNNTILLEEIRSISNKQPKFTPKANRATTMTTTKLVEANHKIRA